MKLKSVIIDLDDTFIEEENSAKKAFYKICDEVNISEFKDLLEIINSL